MSAAVIFYFLSNVLMRSGFCRLQVSNDVTLRGVHDCRGMMAVFSIDTLAYGRALTNKSLCVFTALDLAEQAASPLGDVVFGNINTAQLSC